ncbi:MAG: C-terminal binding protein, partial [Pirellulales bacterium]
MSKYQVLLTDYAWPDLEVERAILADYDAELVVAPATDTATLVKLAPEADAIMTNWVDVRAPVIDAA